MPKPHTARELVLQLALAAALSLLLLWSADASPAAPCFGALFGILGGVQATRYVRSRRRRHELPATIWPARPIDPVLARILRDRRRSA